MLDENGIESVPFLNILMSYSPEGNDSPVLCLVFVYFECEPLMFNELIFDKKISYEYVQIHEDELCSWDG